MAAGVVVSFLPKRPPNTEPRLVGLEVVVVVGAAVDVVPVFDVGAVVDVPAASLGAAVSAAAVPGSASVVLPVVLRTGSPITRDARNRK